VKLGERRPNTKLAGPEHRHLPLHSVPVPPLDLAKVLHAMIPEVAAAFHEYRTYLSIPTTVPPTGGRSALWHVDAAQLVRHGLAEPATHEPSVHICSAFTVVDGDRRRNITWSVDGNSAAHKAGFGSNVPLFHSSVYAAAAIYDAGVQFDLRAGFYQLELTAAERPFFRFYDTQGRLFQMTRLPMGHSAAVDLMQLVTMTIAGNHEVVLPQHRCPHRSPHTYVDGARFAGSPAEAADVLRFWSRSAEFFGATFKAPPLVQQEYDFVGIRFDHRCHTVRLADKTASKIPQSIPTSTTVAELQTLLGRLLFGAGVTRTPLGDFYFAFKAVRRHFNNCNTSRTTLHEPLELTQGCAAKLQQLRDQVLSTVVIRTSPGGISLRFYSDASLKGWGSVLMTDRGRVLVTGGAWGPSELGADISVLEMRAVELGLLAFEVELQSAAHVAIFVDNTSTEAGIRRGNCRSADLAIRLAAAIPLLRALPGRITVGHVPSAENPADPPSRLLDPHASYAEAAGKAHAHKAPIDKSALRWCLTTSEGDKVRDLALWERSWSEDHSLINSSSLRQSVPGRNKSRHARQCAPNAMRATRPAG
jgi:hypothetical protein